MPSDEVDWMMGELVGAEEGKRVEIEPHLPDLHELCRAKTRDVSGSVSVAVGLAADLVDDVIVTSLFGGGLIVDPRIGELTWQLACTRTKGV